MTESTTPKFAIPELPMQIQTIRQYLPHRYPFLLVDRVTEVTDNSIVGYKMFLSMKVPTRTFPRISNYAGCSNCRSISSSFGRSRFYYEQ